MATLDRNLYRSTHQAQFPNGVWKTEGEEAAEGVLYGDIDPRTIVRKGKPAVTRQDWFKDERGFYVERKGTSLHDVEGVFGFGAWKYFRLPEGTVVPDSLKVRRTHFDTDRNATHYQIEVFTGGKLTKDALQGALDNFARNCVVRLKQLAAAGK